MVDFAELQHWDMAAVENLLVELQSSPRMFEKVKRVWSNSNLCRLERIMQFEEFAREMNIEVIFCKFLFTRKNSQQSLLHY